MNAKTELYGNGFLTYNILHDIFGNNSKIILQDNILANISVFGGTCSLMEENEGKDSEKHKNKMSPYSCWNGFTESKNRSYSSSLVRRNAIILNTCHQLTGKNKIFNNLYNSFSFFDNKNEMALKIFKLFYPLARKPNILVDELLSSIKRNNTKNLIREFTYLVCISEKWQKI
jgi:hypothetical protein